MKKLASIPLLLLMLLTLGAEPAKLHYLTAVAVNWHVLPDPPARGSAEEASEVRDVLMIQKTASPQQYEAARKWHKFNVFDFPQLGEKFTAANCPKTEKLFQNIDEEARFVYRSSKLYWKRPRPPALSTEIKPLVNETDFSYPSGHALRGELQAEVLAAMVPEKREELIRQGQEIGYLRLVAGVHFESDLCAGRELAKMIFAKLQKNEQFMKDMNEAKEEIAATTAK